ncbi:PspA/IM30 family protein [Gorillibacterium timonense]|uniref:PspA/IM30 family protein n=1 Tax=Gorillibacterium timonense TaxID=1689269 RepID=UPI0009E8A5A3|nr:PspA/IM30 family protein [Gorillibacterium timonense]
MSVWNRMRDITVATLNDRLEQSEDPVRLIDGYLASLREQIRETERLHSECANHVGAVRNQYLTALSLKQKREEQAVIALKAGEEEIARIALQEKLQQEEICAQYGPLYEEGRASLADLENQIRQLRADFDEIAARRSYYQARMESLRLQRRMNERFSGGGANPSPRAFQRLDERLSDMELESRTLNEVRRSTTQSYGSYGSNSSRLDEEMNRLMNKLGGKLEEKGGKLEEKLNRELTKLEESLEENRVKLEQKLEEKLAKLNRIEK